MFFDDEPMTGGTDGGAPSTDEGTTPDEGGTDESALGGEGQQM